MFKKRGYLLNVCMWVIGLGDVCIYMDMCASACAYMCMSVSAFVHLCICAFVHLCICAFVHLCICAFVHVFTWYMYVCVRRNKSAFLFTNILLAFLLTKHFKNIEILCLLLPYMVSNVACWL